MKLKKGDIVKYIYARNPNLLKTTKLKEVVSEGVVVDVCEQGVFILFDDEDIGEIESWDEMLYTFDSNSFKYNCIVPKKLYESDLYKTLIGDVIDIGDKS